MTLEQSPQPMGNERSVQVESRRTTVSVAAVLRIALRANKRAACLISSERSAEDSAYAKPSIET